MFWILGCSAALVLVLGFDWFASFLIDSLSRKQETAPPVEVVAIPHEVPQVANKPEVVETSHPDNFHDERLAMDDEQEGPEAEEPAEGREALPGRFSLDDW